MSGDWHCHWHSVGFVESAHGWSCPMCPRPTEIDRLQAEITRLRAVNASLVVRNREMAQELDDLKDWRHALQESLSEIEGSAEELARTFHETYKRLAPQFHYETREASAVPWHLVPAVNRNLMIAVAAEILWGGPS